jgi:UDP-N-acetylglucosamine--N-acetylmuramyl-(pentapeptide) pyrophosphoryl-undecaprenol N-acetylglucosamine transferase
MILIPLSGSGTRGDQVENARFFDESGAAWVLTGKDANPAVLAQAVAALAQDAEKRSRMAAAARKAGERDGAAIIAQALARAALARAIDTNTGRENEHGGN